MSKLAGKCGKRTVWCIIEEMDGDLAVKAHNVCAPPGGVCVRTDADCGKNYEKCNCFHAEEVAAQMWLEACEGKPKPAIAYITGHHYICENCKTALKAVNVQEMSVVSDGEAFNAIWHRPPKEELH